MFKDLSRLWLMPLTVTLTIAPGASAHAATPGPAVRITILFNNIPQRPGLTAGWGFSCLVQGLEKTILFDTGADGRVLLDNIRRLDLEPQEVDALFLSHIHADHTGGLDAFLDRHPSVEVILPAAFPAPFRQAVAQKGAQVRAVTTGVRLMDRVYSTGALQDGIVEQAMMVETGKGLVILTGCAHPGIARVVETAVHLTGTKVHLVMGGFHLRDMGRSEIKAVISRLKTFGVEKVAPSHCTGETAMSLLQQAWGKDFVEAGLGAVIELPLH